MRSWCVGAFAIMDVSVSPRWFLRHFWKNAPTDVRRLRGVCLLNTAGAFLRRTGPSALLSFVLFAFFRGEESAPSSVFPVSRSWCGGVRLFGGERGQYGNFRWP
jgi:hypothetical protein